MSPAKREMRALLRLAMPLIGTNICHMLMGTVDVLMVGNLEGTQPLAAVILANVWLSGTMLFGMGVIFGMDPLITQAHGAGDGERAGRTLQRGVIVALVISVIVGALWALTGEFLVLTGQEPMLAAEAHKYALAQIPTVPMYFVYVALRQYLQGREIIKPALLVSIWANVFNAAANYVLIFGALGIPAYGLLGAGIATGLTRGITFLGLLYYIHRDHLLDGAWVPWSKRAFELRGILEVLRHGIVVASQLTLEIAAFGACTLMAGLLGQAEVAAHGIVMNMVSVTFMVPLGVSFATVTRVGNLIGAGEHKRAQTASWVAFALGAGFMALAGMTLAALRFWLPDLYTNELPVAALCASVIPIAAGFQVFDGVQVVGSGILRGMGNMLPALWFNLVGYWVLALPIGWWMAFHSDLRLDGIWYGLMIALGLVAAALLAYTHWRGPATAALPRA
jgi:MATE family multidrug resistance protein